jgi:ABC-type transport system substrate-binding protein
MPKVFPFVGSLIVLLLGFSLPLRAASEVPRRGGTLNVGILKDLSLMNPLVKTSSVDRRIRGLMFEPLLGIDLRGNLQPGLALAWKISPGGKSYLFKLRQGVKFHNGQEMTAEDVKFAIDYTMNPKNGAFGYSRLAGVESVEAADRYTLHISLKTPSAAFLSSLTDIKTFSVIPKGSLPEEMSKLNAYPPGTGPFRFVEWQPDQRIVLRRHEGYWGRGGFLEAVILRPIKDDAMRFVTLQAGDVDMIEHAPFEWAKQITTGRVNGISLAVATYGGFDAIRFNVAGPPFNNKKLRQAVAHAIDRKEILHAAHFGFGEPSEQNYPKPHAWYIDGVAAPKLDYEKARSLVREAGYKGEPIEMVISQEVEKQTMATVLQSQLKKIGINIRIQPLEYSAFTDRERRGDFAFTFSGGSPKTDPSETYAPHFRCEPDLKKRQSNTTGYCDQEVDGLLRKAETEVDVEKRKLLFQQILKKINDDLPILYVGFSPDFIAFRDYAKGFATDHDGSLQWWGGGINHMWLAK